jgi:hypothetical protein
MPNYILSSLYPTLLKHLKSVRIYPHLVNILSLNPDLLIKNCLGIFYYSRFSEYLYIIVLNCFCFHGAAINIDRSLLAYYFFLPLWSIYCHQINLRLISLVEKNLKFFIVAYFISLICFLFIEFAISFFIFIFL